MGGDSLVGTDHSLPLCAQEYKPQDRYLNQSSKCEMGKKINGNVSSSFATNSKNVAFFFFFPSSGVERN